MAFYPINLNITDQLCMVIGGGTVATRKIASLLLCDARIRVISPEVSPEIKQLIAKNKLEWIPRVYMTGDLQGAALAFALTDRPDVQCQITSEAKEQGIPVNIADNPDACTFQTAAIIRRGELLIAISTGGGSPALAAAIRKELELRYGPEYGELVTLLAEIRQLTIGQDSFREKHKQLFTKIIQTNILSLLRNKEWLLLQEQLQEILPPEINARYLVQKIRGY
jgi:precorrin-2 dehydrogenase / sirohydrochlorin ferrochelatase